MRCRRRPIKVRKFPPFHITVNCEGKDRLVVMISEIYLPLPICPICSGVVSVLLDQELAFCPSDQLRVMICGDAIIQPNSGQQHLPVSLRLISIISVFISFSYFKQSYIAWCYWIVKENFTLVRCRVSWLIWARCGRGLTSSTPLSPLSWWQHTVAGTAAVVPWRCCDPMECSWTRRTVWPGPHEVPSCLCSDLTSCSMAALAAWRSYEVTSWDWSVWTNLPGKCQCNSEPVNKQVKSSHFWGSKNWDYKRSISWQLLLHMTPTKISFWHTKEASIIHFKTATCVKAMVAH